MQNNFNFSTLEPLLKQLADGHFHTLPQLTTHLQITTSSLAALFTQISQLGLELIHDPIQGYRLNQAFELLDAEKIKTHLSTPLKLETMLSVDSTNQYLLEKAKQQQVTEPWAVFAEHQSAGRGRRGRYWHSPFATNLYLSLLWPSSQSISQFSGLSLALGVAVIAALEQYGIREGLQLKWPNDVYWNGRKLVGILLEAVTQQQQSTQIVVGIGMNMQQPPEAQTMIDQPWVDLATITGQRPSRNIFAGLLLQKLLETLAAYQVQGLAPFHSAWQRYDFTYGKAITLSTPTQVIQGIAQGVNAQGELLVTDAQGRQLSFSYGEVSLRLCAKNSAS